MDFVKTISQHFRIICLFTLLAAIVVFSLSFHEQNENLPFRTYVFNINGTGSVGNVKTLLDFKNGTYGLLADISPGNYTLKSSAGAALMVGDKGACLAKDPNSACNFEVTRQTNISALFNSSVIMPNGRFRFTFPNRTDFSLKIVLGDRYIYKDLLSLLPRDVHGHYSLEDDTVLIQTVSDVIGDDGKTDFIDFDLYTLDQKAHEANRETDWRQDIIIEPLVVAFLLLFISDIIDYAHKYLKEKYVKEEAKREAKR